MGYTNSTANLKLPQYVGTDQPKYIPDFNTAMLNIDNGYKKNNDAIENNTTFINDLRTDLTADEEQIAENKRLSEQVSNLTTQTPLVAKPISGSITNATVLAGGTGVTFYIKIEGDINKEDLTSIGTLTDYVGQFDVYVHTQLTINTSLFSGFSQITSAGEVACGLANALEEDGVYHIVIIATLPFDPYNATT